MPLIIRGQKISRAKFEIAKELRQQMTHEERVLWNFLRGNRLNSLHFRRQQIIDGYIVDFYCHSASLVVEVDGEIHEYQAEKDKERDRILMEKGLKVVRIKNDEVRSDIKKVLVKIVAVCDQSKIQSDRDTPSLSQMNTCRMREGAGG